VPSASARTLVSIFMASIVSSRSPLVTFAPTIAFTVAMVPGIGDRTAIAIKAAVEQSSGKTVSVNTATGEIDES